MNLISALIALGIMAAIFVIVWIGLTFTAFATGFAISVTVCGLFVLLYSAVQDIREGGDHDPDIWG